jgi:aspartyl-tRNA(Asn)/glutamyl-tRNA(Gln) amidotransferase subunit B
MREMLDTGQTPDSIIEFKGLTKISDEEKLRELVDQVIEEFPKAVEDAIADPKAANFLVGQVMRKTRGRADPEQTNLLVRSKIEELSG